MVRSKNKEPSRAAAVATATRLSSSKNECLPVVSLYGRVIPLSLKRFKCILCAHLMCSSLSLQEQHWHFIARGEIKKGNSLKEEEDDDAKEEKVCMSLVVIYWTTA